MNRRLTLRRGGGTPCSECSRVIVAAHPALVVTDPAGEVLGLFHRTCLAGAKRLGLQRPGELDLTMVYLDDAERN